jgi:hypothetical protein
MALTVLGIKNARPQAKAHKLSDERSLFLLVMPNGAKYWRLRYRLLGKQKTLARLVTKEDRNRILSLAESMTLHIKEVRNGFDSPAISTECSVIASCPLRPISNASRRRSPGQSRSRARLSVDFSNAH